MIAGNELMISKRKSRKLLNRDISTDNNLIYHFINRNNVLEVLLKRTHIDCLRLVQVERRLTGVNEECQVIIVSRNNSNNTRPGYILRRRARDSPSPTLFLGPNVRECNSEALMINMVKHCSQLTRKRRAGNGCELDRNTCFVV
jgi:hypothetical protein